MSYEKKKVHDLFYSVLNNESYSVAATFTGLTAEADADAYIASKQPQPPDPILPEVGRTNNLPASADAPNSIELAERSVYLFATIYYGGCVERITKSQAKSLSTFIKHGNEILSLLNYLVEKHHHTPQGEKALRILRDVEKGEWE